MANTAAESITPAHVFHIDRTLYTGRPADLTGRPEKEKVTYDLLDKLGIAYQRLDHDPTATIEACHDIDALLETEICKNLFLRNAQKNSFYLLMIPGCQNRSARPGSLLQNLNLWNSI